MQVNPLKWPQPLLHLQIVAVVAATRVAGRHSQGQARRNGSWRSLGVPLLQDSVGRRGSCCWQRPTACHQVSSTCTVTARLNYPVLRFVWFLAHPFASACRPGRSLVQWCSSTLLGCFCRSRSISIPPLLASLTHATARIPPSLLLHHYAVCTLVAFVYGLTASSSVKNQIQPKYCT